MVFQDVSLGSDMENQENTVHDADPMETDVQDYVLILVTEAGIQVARLPASGSLVIGRGSKADVRVTDTRMSRRHARIHLGTSLRVEDLCSVNGTSLNGNLLVPGQTRTFQPDDMLRAGGTAILLRSHPRGEPL